MNILVCISHVPDTTTKIKFEADGSALDKTGVTFIINPYDEFGLSRAIELSEAGKADQITVLCVGGPEVEPTIRKALAIGADKGVRISADAEDGYSAAKYIADYAREREFGIIFMGKESIDFNGAQVPGMVAEMLDMPFISFATKFELKDDRSAEVHREISGGHEVVDTTLPVVMSTQKGVAEWRIPNMRGIMAARKKPLEVVQPEKVEPLVKTVKLEQPPAKGGCTYIEPDEAEKLIDILNEKGLI